MGKSIRSKAKRSWRSKKRDDSVYAATEAARLQRLNAKLRAIASTDVLEDDDDHADGEEATEENAAEGSGEGVMDVDAGAEAAVPEEDAATPSEAKVSTHGPRRSRREEWRKSKGMTPRPKPRGMNRQGGVAGKRKPGRSNRRR